MNPVMIDNTVRTAIKELVGKAFANPVSLESIKARIAAGENVTNPEARSAETDAFHDDLSLIIPSGYKVVFTVEEQPGGLSRHLSMSSPTPGRAPIPAAVQMVMDEFGFETPLQECFIYPETFQQNWVAINVIERIKGDTA